MAAPISGPGPGPDNGGSGPALAAAVPAQLGFLAIYNPSLGTTDETMEDQIAYYSSVTSSASSQGRRWRKSHHQQEEEDDQNSPAAGAGREKDEGEEEARNERLRQIGLAQGMVEFGRSFSGDRAVDTVETERSRVVLRELEPGWWILASVDLTRLPVVAGPSSSTTAAAAAAAKGGGGAGAGVGPLAVEYSTREVKPAALLLQDLLRAHAVFLLHHGSSLSALLVRAGRVRFARLLARFWDLFLASWNVMLHGNPLRNVFGGIKMAACGELGFGVGEEDRGSGEREVLEGLVGRIDGLVDLVVGKFGEADESGDDERMKSEGEGTRDRWLGTGCEPGAEDGAIFLGVGALSRQSLRDVTFWMEDLYTWGENAYGVRESPTAAARSHVKRRKPASKATASTPTAPPTRVPAVKPQSPQPSSPTGFVPPPPIVRPAAPRASGSDNTSGSAHDDTDTGGMDKMMGYLKLGYGTYWTLGSSSSAQDKEAAAAGGKAGDSSTSKSRPSAPPKTSKSDAAAHYLIGLIGNMEEETTAVPGSSTDDVAEEQDLNSRILLRTLTVELESEGADKPEWAMSHDLGSNDTELAPPPSGQPKQQHAKSPGSSQTAAAAAVATESQETKSPSLASSSSSSSSPSARSSGTQRHHPDASDSQSRTKTPRKLRVVAYAARPFLYVLLFDAHTDSLNWAAAYRSLHNQLAPLRRPLLASTAYRPSVAGPAAGGGAQRIYDLVWDPAGLTVHSTIPHIPAVAAAGKRGAAEEEVWTRVEALNTHVQLLNTHAATRWDGSAGQGQGQVELERTAKTSRGWWIVWSRVLEGKAGRQAAGGSAAAGPDEDAGGLGEGKGDGRVGEDGESRRSDSADDETATVLGDGGGGGPAVGKEIFLIRRSGDSAAGGAGGGVRSYVSVGGVSGGGWADGASRLAQGIGVDTRKYIEGLLSLNR